MLKQRFGVKGNQLGRVDNIMRIIRKAGRDLYIREERCANFISVVGFY